MSYWIFTRNKKAITDKIFTMPNADTLRAFGPNGSGRAPANPNRADASSVTQHVNVTQTGNQSSKIFASAIRRTEPADTAAISRVTGTIDIKQIVAAKIIRRKMLAWGI